MKPAALRHDLTSQMVQIRDLVPWDRNPRHNDAAAERLAYTIQAHGWTTPLLVQAGSNRVIGGHTRIKAALKLGLDEVPAVFLDVDDRQADAIAIADNRLGEMATWDDRALADLLEGLQADGADLLAIGYDDADLASMRASRQFKAGRKLVKVHQNVLVFVKGDWREAVKALPDPTDRAGQDAGSGALR